MDHVERVTYLIVETNVHEVPMHVSSEEVRADQMGQAERVQFFHG